MSFTASLDITCHGPSYFRRASVTESEEPELDPVIKEYAICKHFTPALIGRHMQWNAEAEKQGQFIHSRHK
jgi:hypothetical protein